MPMNRRLFLAVLCPCPPALSCTTSKESPAMEHDSFVEFESEIGNKLFAPAQWLTEGESTSWYLRSPDNNAAISVFTYTAEGSGSLDEFGDLIAKWSLPDGETDWQKSDWNSIALEHCTARVRQLVPVPDASKLRLRVYTAHTGRLYHALVLSVSEIAMDLNGEFYEGIVKTFRGIE